MVIDNCIGVRVTNFIFRQIIKICNSCDADGTLKLTVRGLDIPTTAGDFSTLDTQIRQTEVPAQRAEQSRAS